MLSRFPSAFRVRPKASSHPLVDDNDTGRACRVVRVEIPPAHQRHVHGLKVTGRDDVVVDQQIRVGRRRVTLDDHSHLLIVAKEFLGKARGLDAGQRLDPLQKLVVENLRTRT